MGKYMVLWEIDQSRIPVDPKERAEGWSFLTDVPYLAIMPMA